MKFVFWQNILSPHQSDFLSELSNKHEVTLVVTSQIDSHRKGQNWKATYSENVKIIISPTIVEIIHILRSSEDNQINCFSGFFAYPKISFALLLSCFYGNKNSIISEAVSTGGVKNKCKLLIRKALALCVSKNIQQVFAIGVEGKKYFESLSFIDEKVSEFGYFVSSPEPPLINTIDYYSVFVGRLIELKGIFPILDMCRLNTHKNMKFKIVGSGPLESIVKEYVEVHQLTNIELIADIPRKEVLNIISHAQCLLLPNTGDEGWGVVVNEALLQGTPVICSSKTGSNVAVQNNVQGVVLNEVTAKGIAKGLDFCVNLDANQIIALAEKQLLPEVGAKYFIDQLGENRNEYAPWRSNGGHS